MSASASVMKLTKYEEKELNLYREKQIEFLSEFFSKNPELESVKFHQGDKEALSYLCEFFYHLAETKRNRAKMTTALNIWSSLQNKKIPAKPGFKLPEKGTPRWHALINKHYLLTVEISQTPSPLQDLENTLTQEKLNSVIERCNNKEILANVLNRVNSAEPDAITKLEQLELVAPWIFVRQYSIVMGHVSDCNNALKAIQRIMGQSAKICETDFQKFPLLKTPGFNYKVHRIYSGMIERERILEQSPPPQPDNSPETLMSQTLNTVKANMDSYSTSRVKVLTWKFFSSLAEPVNAVLDMLPHLSVNERQNQLIQEATVFMAQLLALLLNNAERPDPNATQLTSHFFSLTRNLIHLPALNQELLTQLLQIMAGIKAKGNINSYRVIACNTLSELVEGEAFDFNLVRKPPDLQQGNTSFLMEHEISGRGSMEKFDDFQHLFEQIQSNHAAVTDSDKKVVDALKQLSVLFPYIPLTQVNAELLLNFVAVMANIDQKHTCALEILTSCYSICQTIIHTNKDWNTEQLAKLGNLAVQVEYRQLQLLLPLKIQKLIDGLDQKTLKLPSLDEFYDALKNHVELSGMIGMDESILQALFNLLNKANQHENPAIRTLFDTQNSKMISALEEREPSHPNPVRTEFLSRIKAVISLHQTSCSSSAALAEPIIEEPPQYHEEILAVVPLHQTSSSSSEALTEPVIEQPPQNIADTPIESAQQTTAEITPAETSFDSFNEELQQRALQLNQKWRAIFQLDWYFKGLYNIHRDQTAMINWMTTSQTVPLPIEKPSFIADSVQALRANKSAMESSLSFIAQQLVTFSSEYRASWKEFNEWIQLTTGYLAPIENLSQETLISADLIHFYQQKHLEITVASEKDDANRKLPNPGILNFTFFGEGVTSREKPVISSPVGQMEP